MHDFRQKNYSFKIFLNLSKRINSDWKKWANLNNNQAKKYENERSNNSLSLSHYIQKNKNNHQGSKSIDFFPGTTHSNESAFELLRRLFGKYSKDFTEPVNRFSILEEISKTDELIKLFKDKEIVDYKFKSFNFKEPNKIYWDELVTLYFLKPIIKDHSKSILFKDYLHKENQLLKDQNDQVKNEKNLQAEKYTENIDSNNIKKSFSKLKITIPEPFNFETKNKTRPCTKQAQKFQEMISTKENEMNLALNYKFRANSVPKICTKEILYSLQKKETERRKENFKKNQEKLIKKVKAYSFYEKDMKKRKEKEQILILGQSRPDSLYKMKFKPPPRNLKESYVQVIKKTEDTRLSFLMSEQKSTSTYSSYPRGLQKHEIDMKLRREKKLQKLKKELELKFTFMPNSKQINNNATGKTSKKRNSIRSSKTSRKEIKRNKSNAFIQGGHSKSYCDFDSFNSPKEKFYYKKDSIQNNFASKEIIGNLFTKENNIPKMKLTKPISPSHIEFPKSNFISSAVPNSKVYPLHFQNQNKIKQFEKEFKDKIELIKKHLSSDYSSIENQKLENKL